MIVIKGYLRIKADQRAAFDAALPALLAATRAEAGNGVYLYAVDVDDPAVVHVYEEWTDEDAVAAHMAAPHLAEFMTAVGGAVEELDFTRHEVSASRPLFG